MMKKDMIFRSIKIKELKNEKFKLINSFEKKYKIYVNLDTMA